MSSWRRLAGGPGGDDGSTEPLTPEELAVKLVLAFLLILLAQTFTGLNIGLFALDCGQLQVIIDAEKTQAGAKRSAQARHAAIVLPLRRLGNLTLCTILLGNTMVNAAMALLMAGLAGGLIGWLLTTSLIVYIGEILPQSVCTRHGLRLGAYGAPIIWLFVVVLFPITKLYAIVLDRLFPDEDGIMDRAGWRNMIEFQQDGHPGSLPDYQSSMLLGSLCLAETSVREVMVPMERTVYLELDDEVNFDKLRWIQQKRVTRLPVYDKSMKRFIGFLHCKDLLRDDLGVDVQRGGAMPVAALLKALECHGQRREICQIPESMSLLDLVDMFKHGKPHLVFVCAEPDINVQSECASPHIGLVTLHDVLERILRP